MFKQKISTRAAVLGLIILFLILAQLKWKQWQSEREIEKQRQSILQQADALQKKNDELNQSLQYLNSPDFKENVARQQLGLKKQGEQVYSFANNSANPGQDQTGDGQSNLKKWWGYFFGN